VLAGSSTIARAQEAPTLALGLVRTTSAYVDTSNDPQAGTGARLTLAVEKPPIAPPSPGTFDASVRLVPELFVGFTANHRRASGLFGAGLRGELQLARSCRAPDSCHFVIIVYAAVHAMLGDRHLDPGNELVGGTYTLLGRARVGLEIGPSIHRIPDGSRVLDTVTQVYVGWRF
jgi:hypothetical protein